MQNFFQFLFRLGVTIILSLFAAFLVGATAKLMVICFKFGWGLWNG